jgi:hypothetical protein
MVPATYTNYFLGSSSASAALIGLLFVAISLAPAHIFGAEATPARRALASSAFMALLDAFFVSLVALIPATNIGYAALALAMIGLINTLSLSRHFWEAWHAGHPQKRITLLLGSFIIYAWQLTYAVDLLRQPRDTGAVAGLAYLLLGTYAVGLGRAWELLGAPDEGLLMLVGLRHIPTEDAGPKGNEQPTEPAAAETQTDGTSGRTRT